MTRLLRCVIPILLMMIQLVPLANTRAETTQTGWIALPSMTLPRLQHTATLLNNGKVLVVGGNTTLWIPIRRL